MLLDLAPPTLHSLEAPRGKVKLLEGSTNAEYWFLGTGTLVSLEPPLNKSFFDFAMSSAKGLSSV